MKKILLPNMYAKSIFTINYEKLKKQGIKTLIFDLDNTLVEPNVKTVSKKTVDLFEKLKKDFCCIVLSNTINANKVKEIGKKLNIPYLYFALKPTLIGYKRCNKFHNSKKKEVCMIGDQYFTDLKGARNAGYFCVLVDPIGPHEGFYTKINRIREKKQYKKINFERGKYYE